MLIEIIFLSFFAILTGICCAIFGMFLMRTLKSPDGAKRWRLRFEGAADRVESSVIGRAFDAAVGIRMARRSLDRALTAGDLKRFLAVAQRYELVGEAAELMASRRSLDEAAAFAQTAGHEGLARRLFRRAHDAHAARGAYQRAAASAESAGCYDLAVRALRRLPDGGGVRARAQLAERHGHHRDAMLAYLDAECGGDALRVADAGGLLEALVEEVSARSDAALWRIGANAAVQLGAPSRAVELCLRAGDLTLAHSIARKAKLGAFEDEINQLLRARRAREQRDLLHGYAGMAT